MNKKMRELKAKIEVLRDEATEKFDKNDVEGAEEILNQIKDVEREYNVASKLFKEEKEELPVETIIEDIKKPDITNKIKNFVDGVKMVANTLTPTTNEDGGYVIPEEVLTDIQELRESKESLEDLVTVKTTTKASGKETYKKRSQMTGFSKVGAGSKIGQKATPKFSILEWAIDKYAGIYPVENEMFDDTDENIYQTLIEWIADESRVTRNNIIRDVIKAKQETELKGLDDIKYVLNVTLGAKFKSTSVVVTNDDGIQYLDTLKDKDGNYILQKNPTDPMKLVLSAGGVTVPIKNFANDTIPTVNDKIPMIIGDLKEGIKLWDRKKLNIVPSNVAVVGTGDDQLNAYEEDLTLFRAIERLCSKKRDDEAFVNGYITATASSNSDVKEETPTNPVA